MADVNKESPPPNFGIEFIDPRGYNDRRMDHRDQPASPNECRRTERRRQTPYLYNDQWWLKRRYAR